MNRGWPTGRSRLGRWLAAAGCWSLLAGAAEQQVTAVRFWSLGPVTRVAIETHGPVEYRAERLSNPDRLFFDLLSAVPREQRRTVRVIPVGDERLKQVRVALTRPGVTRVVLDLTGPADYSASQLTNPDRIMIELRPASPAPYGPPVSRIDAAPEPPAVEASALAFAPTAALLPAPPAPVPPPDAAASPPATLPAAPAPATTLAATAPAAVQKPAPPSGQLADVPQVARSAQRDSRGNRSLIRALGLKVGKVVLDPGHGGHDTGTIGPTGLQEKDLVLDLALRLGRLISERMSGEVVFTRTDDRYVPLEGRTELANQCKADLFLSIHANSSRLRSAAGPEAFYLNFTTDPSALEVAARENAPSARTIHELQDMVLKIAQKEKTQESREFAAHLQKALYRHARGSAGRNRGVKSAPFVVLIGAQMPSVLVEVAFLSNPKEERLLKQPEYRQKLAEALYRGLFEYSTTLSHFQLARGAGQ